MTTEQPDEMQPSTELEQLAQAIEYEWRQNDHVYWYLRPMAEHARAAARVALDWASNADALLSPPDDRRFCDAPPSPENLD